LSTVGAELLSQDLITKLTAHGQDHTISWLKKGLLSIEQSSTLCDTLMSLDLQRISTAFESTKALDAAANDSIEPPDISTYDSIESMSPQKISELEAIGNEEIGNGKAAVIILGGGQVR
jgi:UDP-N-acetylglucosamine pyrophosphorylase